MIPEVVIAAFINVMFECQEKERRREKMHLLLFAFKFDISLQFVKGVHRLVCRFQEIILTVDDAQNHYQRPTSHTPRIIKSDSWGVDVGPL